MRINLGNTPLFRGMTVPDIEEMLRCLRAAERTYKKGAVILPEGTPTEQLGVVLSGRVIIEMGDVWGNNSVLSSVGAGGIFAEAYACVPGEPLMLPHTSPISMMTRPDSTTPSCSVGVPSGRMTAPFL